MIPETPDEDLDIPEDDEEMLEDRAREMIESQLSSIDDEEVREEMRDGLHSNDDPLEMRRKQNELDERAEDEASSRIPGPWSREEIEFLKNNRHGMDNDDMEEFLRKEKEVQGEDLPFSRNEKRFILFNFNDYSAEEIADSLMRDEEDVRMQMKLMGLKGEE
ncbi:MAG: hypothetical protein ABEK01_03535 [Candidatus Nanohaloarchaea archaeon]